MPQKGFIFNYSFCYKVGRSSYFVAFGLAVMAVIIVAGVLVWRQLQVPAEVEQPADETANLPAKALATEGWKTYRNEALGFSFRYPPDWVVKNDTLPGERKETIARENLTIGDDSIPENPGLVLWVNPLGFGVVPPDIVYELALDSNNRIIIVSREEMAPEQGEGMTNIDDTTVIFCKTAELGTNTYAFIFSFTEGGKSFEPIFNQMLSTFQFLE